MVPINKKLFDVLRWVSIIMEILIAAVIGLQQIYGFTPNIALTMGIINSALLSFLQYDSHEYHSQKELNELENKINQKDIDVQG